MVDKNTNWMMVFFAFVMAVALAFLLKTLDKRRIDINYPEQGGRSIGGWVTVLGITLFSGGIIQMMTFVSSNYFSYETWISLREAGGINLQLTFTLELALSLLWLCGVFAAIYWFLNRRDIFPQMFMWYVGSLIGGELLLVVLYSSINYPATLGNIQLAYIIAFVRTLIYGSIWVTFVIRSERVKETFVE